MSAIDKAFEFIAPRENKPLYDFINDTFKTSGVFNPLKLKDVDQSKFTYTPNRQTEPIPLLGIYKDPSGNDTYGYGLEIKNISAPAKTVQEMELQFKEKLQKNLNFVESLTDVNNKRLNLDDNQKAALVSLVYNVGETAFKNSKAYNEGLKVGNMDVFLKEAFDKDEGFTKITSELTGEKIFSQGLFNRRQEEKDLFLTAEREREKETAKTGAGSAFDNITIEELEGIPKTRSDLYSNRFFKRD